MINLKTLIDTDVDNFSIGKFFDFAGGQPIIEETVQDWIKECLAKAIVDKRHHSIASGDTHVEVSPIQRINKNSILIEIRWINSKGLKEKSLVLSRSEFAQVVKDLRPEIQKICQERYEDAKQGEF